MKNFTYYRPETAEASGRPCSSPRWGTAELLAGGTDLLDLQKEYIAQPDKVVSLAAGRLGDCCESARQGSSRRFDIGAGVKLADIAAMPSYRSTSRPWPRRPARSAARRSATWARSAATSASATAAGTSATSTSHCLLKGGDKCFALDGENRYHADFHAGPQVRHRQSLDAGAGADRTARHAAQGARPRKASGRSDRQVLPRSVGAGRARARPGRQRDGAVGAASAGQGPAQERQLRGAAEAVVRLAAGAGGRCVQAGRRQGHGACALSWATWRQCRTSPRPRPGRSRARK